GERLRVRARHVGNLSRREKVIVSQPVQQCGWRLELHGNSAENRRQRTENRGQRVPASFSWCAVVSPLFFVFCPLSSVLCPLFPVFCSIERTRECIHGRCSSAGV